MQISNLEHHCCLWLLWLLTFWRSMLCMTLSHAPYHALHMFACLSMPKKKRHYLPHFSKPRRDIIREQCTAFFVHVWWSNSTTIVFIKLAVKQIKNSANWMNAQYAKNNKYQIASDTNTNTHTNKQTSKTLTSVYSCVGCLLSSFTDLLLSHLVPRCTQNSHYRCPMALKRLKWHKKNHPKNDMSTRLTSCIDQINSTENSKINQQNWPHLLHHHGRVDTLCDGVDSCWHTQVVQAFVLFPNGVLGINARSFCVRCWRALNDKKKRVDHCVTQHKGKTKMENPGHYSFARNKITSSWQIETICHNLRNLRVFMQRKEQRTNHLTISQTHVKI